MPRIAILLLIAGTGFYAGRVGLQFRRWMWDTTVPIRFVSDIDRGYQWGYISAREGYLNQYEKMRSEQPTDDDWLDYAPLRLGVMALWGNWSKEHFPQFRLWHQVMYRVPDRSYELTAPVLHFNLFMEVVGLISAFFLTRLWAIRGDPSPPVDRDTLAYFFRGCIPGLIAVLLLWFNPAIVLSAYGWPTWDLWIIPMFLLAAWLASADWWFAAGLAIGIGAMFKGQQLLAAPAFVIWSLILFRPLATLKFLGGVVTAIAIITSPWMLSYIPPDQLAHARAIQSQYDQVYQVPINTFKLDRIFDLPALIWVAGILIGAAILPWVSWLKLTGPATKGGWRKILASPWAWRGIAALAAFTLVVWPWLLQRNRSDWEIGCSAACLLASFVLFIRPRGIPRMAVTAAAVALLLCISVFHGSSAWYDCSIHFGTVHWPILFVGMTDNLPAILNGDFNWPMECLPTTAVTVPAHLLWHYPADAIDVSMKALLQSLFWITFTLCSLGLGLQARRRDRRVLVALVALWLMFFCFPPQIHERYLLFAAGVSCICAAASTGMTLLGIFLSIMTFIMTLSVMLNSGGEGHRTQFGRNLAHQFPSLFSENSGEKLRSLANGMHPDVGYAILLCGLIFLYFSLALRKRSQSAKSAPSTLPAPPSDDSAIKVDTARQTPVPAAAFLSSQDLPSNVESKPSPVRLEQTEASAAFSQNAVSLRFSTMTTRRFTAITIGAIAGLAAGAIPGFFIGLYMASQSPIKGFWGPSNQELVRLFTPTGALAAIGSVIGVRIAVNIYPGAVPGAGKCMRCGDDLRATPDRCPECGSVSKTDKI